ncbi:hypothetical protein ETH01_24100 [Enterococcus thailandicus]|uniref:Uncharacterized protein n=2 Tax=Enterococcus TaxID=1350 RepID=A0A510WG41_ENTTH|nr:hypothetical protein ETH01_24100 [Enterococcus thailandicus]
MYSGQKNSIGWKLFRFGIKFFRQTNDNLSDLIDHSYGIIKKNRNKEK